MVPFQVTMIPTYVLMKNLGLIDKLSALIIPGVLGGPFGTFLLRQFFLTIPDELEDAARIDGAGYFTLYAQIIMPLSKAALATLAVFVFLGNWNDFLWPLVITNSSQMRTLQVGLATIQEEVPMAFGTLMAGATFAAIPITIVFLIFQRYFLKGLTVGALKG